MEGWVHGNCKLVWRQVHPALELNQEDSEMDLPPTLGRPAAGVAVGKASGMLVA